MAFEHLQLSKTSTDMFNDILHDMRERKFISVNFQLLLWGVINSSTENSIYCELENYLYGSGQIQPSDVEDSLSVMMSLLGSNSVSGNQQTSNQSNSKKSSGKKKNKKKSNSAPKPKQPESNDELPKSIVVFTFKDAEGKTIEFPVDEEVEKVFEQLFELIRRHKITTLEPIHLTSAMFQVNNKCFIQFFKDINADYDLAKKYFAPEKIMVCGIIPYQLSSFLSTLNDKVDGNSPCEILCRDEEVELIWNICLKKNKRNTIIVGEPGVGKSALIEKLTHDINSGNGPSEFKDFNVLVLDVNALIAGTSYRGDAEERIKELINFLESNHDIILFIDEVHTILGAGSCFEGEMDLANALKPILARGETIVIGATTEAEYEKYFKQDGALSRRFEKVEVKEPRSEKVYPMIKNKLLSLTKYHGVTISKELVDYSILIASCFAFEKRNPDKTLDLIDRAMVAAKRSGKTFVDKDSVLKNFGIEFKLWDKMSIDSRTEVAYHEAGHYIVGKASGKLTRYIWLAVSIMPAEDYLGVTVYEHDDENVPYRNPEYFIDDIAFSLGGRAAENMFRPDFTSGASCDLQMATKDAFYLVTKLGMGNDSIKNRVYLNSYNYPMFSEKALDMVNAEVDKIIQKAYTRAQNLLNENKDILEAIVAALLEKRIMSEIELDQVWQEVVKKRTA